VSGPFFFVEARLNDQREWKRITDEEVFKLHKDKASAVREAKHIEKLFTS
jgi:hypothetical protein